LGDHDGDKADRTGTASGFGEVVPLREAAGARAAAARKESDRLAVDAWNKRMLAFQGPAQPSPTLSDARNAGYGYLEVRCLGCEMNQTVPLDMCAGRRRRRFMNHTSRLKKPRKVTQEAA
jgi:hypothetical protein